MIKHIFLAAICLLGLDTFAQDKVELIARGKREVEPAYRMTETPAIIDTIIPTPLVEYPLLSLKHDARIDLETIDPATVKIVDKLPQLYHSYIKAGVGSELMPLGEFYFDGLRSRKYQYGTHLKHVSSYGNIKGYAPAQFDRNEAKVFGSINERRYSLLGDLHFKSKGFHYYGIPNDSLVRDSIAQRFTDVGGDFSYSSHKKDSARVNYSVGLNYNYFASQKPLVDSLKDWKARENYIGLSGKFWGNLGKELFSADLSIKYNGYKYGIADSSLSFLDTGIVLNNTVISLKPSITTFSMNNRFKGKVGLDVTVDAHNETRVYVYPNAEIKYSMFNDIFIPYGGVRGGLKQNTFKRLSSENEFILPQVVMKNESNSIDAYLGIKGTLSRRIGFNMSASFAHIKNKALFVTDTNYSIGNKFNVIFDTLNVTTLEGSISYQLKEKLKVDVIGRYFSYSLRNNTYAWNLPQFQIITRGAYNLYDKLMLNLDLNFEGGRRALVYAQEENVSIEDDQFAKTLGFVADINLGLEYRYNKRISAFLQFNNLAAQRYKRWYNAPVQGFQVMGGFTFRF
jgi:hypothetical protein